MYDELVKRLRSEAVYLPEKFSKNAELLDVLMKAADAIEELTGFVQEAERDRDEYRERLDKAADAIEELQGKAKILERIADKWCDAVPKWIPVAERLPSDFVSVQAHMTDAGNFPPVREAYVVDKLWFFPALKEFHPVDMWRQFDEPPKEE